MTGSCSRCGQLLPFDGARAWADLNSNVVVVDGARVQLTPKQCELVVALLRAAPRTVPRGHLMDMLYGQKSGEPIEKILDVMVCKIRKKLAGTALRIITKQGFQATLA